MAHLIFTWPYALVFSLVFLCVFAPELGILRRPHERSSAQNAKSRRLIESGGSLAAFAAFKRFVPFVF